MSILHRMSDLVQGKLNTAMNAAEDPGESMELAYAKQMETLQQVRRNVADVLTSEKRLEMQAAQLQASVQKLQAQAQQALQQQREDLARVALTRAQGAQAQLDGLNQQIVQLKQQEQNLEVMAQKLQAKVEAFRTQKETIKAQYTAAQASTKIGESVTGLSEQMADVSMMVDRAQEKTAQMQARAEAVNQLLDTGVLDQIGPGQTDDLDRQLSAGQTDAAVELQLAAMKQQLQLPASTAAQTFVVRIQGNDQYRISQADHAQLDGFDAALVKAIQAGDEVAFHSSLAAVLQFVRSRGTKLDATSLESSQVILPAEDMTLDEARKIMESNGAPAPA